MSEAKKKTSNGFSILKIVNFVVAAYFIILGLGLNLPYLNLIPFNLVCFLVAGLLVFATIAGPSEHGMRKRIAHDLEHK